MTFLPRSLSRLLLILLVPVVFAVAALRLARDRGPLWLGFNSDPSYQYLMNSLLVMNGAPPCHVDHPGTTVQVLGSIALTWSTPGTNNAERTSAVLADPERSLALLHATFIGLAAVGIAIAGLLILRSSDSLACAVTFQLVPLLMPATWEGTLFVAPEALLVPLTLLVCAVLFVRECGAGPVPLRLETWLSVGIGILAGAAAVTKITFVPLCLLPLLVSRSWRASLWTLLALLVSAAMYLLPIMGQLPRVLHWYEGLATHTGTYGSGAAGFIDRAAYVSNLLSLLASAPAATAIGLASLAVALAVVIRHRDDSRLARPARCLLVAVAIQTLDLLLVAKHPGARYVLPAAASVAFNVAVLVALLTAWPSPGARPRTPWLLVLGGAAAVVLMVAHLVTFSRQLRSARDRQLAAARQVERLTADGIRVEYYRCSSLPFALYFGNGAAWTLFGPQLAALHPQGIFFNNANGTFEGYEKRIPAEAVFRERKVYLVGSGTIEHLPAGITVPRPTGWTMRLVAQESETTVHVIEPPR